MGLLCVAYAVMESLAVVCTLMNRALHIQLKAHSQSTVSQPCIAHERDKGLSWSQMVVPVAAISMKDGECYKFIIYNKSGFEKAYKQYSNHQE